MPTTLTAPVVVARVQQAACSRPRRVAACPQPASASCPAHIARGLSHAGAPRHSVVVSASRTQPIVFAAATAPDWQVGRQTGETPCGGSGLVSWLREVAGRGSCFHSTVTQVLAKAEIPSHIPRQDFLKQMYVWSTQHVADAQKIYGVIMEVDTIDVKQPDGEEITEAFTISLLKFIDDKCVPSAARVHLSALSVRCCGAISAPWFRGCHPLTNLQLERVPLGSTCGGRHYPNFPKVTTRDVDSSVNG